MYEYISICVWPFLSLCVWERPGMVLKGGRAARPASRPFSTESHTSLWATAEATFKRPGHYPGTREWQITVSVSSPLRHAPAMIHTLNQRAGSGLVSTNRRHRKTREGTLKIQKTNKQKTAFYDCFPKEILPEDTVSI